MFKNLVIVFVVIISLNAQAKGIHSVVTDRSVSPLVVTASYIAGNQIGELSDLSFLAELSHLNQNATPQVTKYDWRIAFERVASTEEHDFSKERGFSDKLGDSSKQETAGTWLFRLAIMLVVVYLFKNGPLVIKSLN